MNISLQSALLQSIAIGVGMKKNTDVFNFRVVEFEIDLVDG